VSGGLDEEQAAVDTGILDITFALRCEFLPQVRGVLILDVLDDGVPAAVIVDQITIAGGIDNVESQTDAILLDDVGNGLDLGGLADRLIGLQSTLGVDQVRSKDGVDQSRLSKTSLANTDDIELETTLQELALDLRRDAVETDMAVGVDGGLLWEGRHREGQGEIGETVLCSESED